MTGTLDMGSKSLATFVLTCLWTSSNESPANHLEKVWFSEPTAEMFLLRTKFRKSVRKVPLKKKGVRGKNELCFICDIYGT